MSRVDDEWDTILAISNNGLVDRSIGWHVCDVINDNSSVLRLRSFRKRKGIVVTTSEILAYYAAG